MRQSFWLLGLLAALLLVSCGIPQSGGTQLVPQPDPQPDPVADPQPEESVGTDDELIVYSGRSEELIAPLIERFEEVSGIRVGVRYGETAQMAATILEEGDNSPADVFFAQDAGALGALAAHGRLIPLPDDLLNRVEPRFRSSQGLWVGISGRARVVAYNTARVDPAELPDSIFGFTDPRWKGRIGWVPTNGSFQAFVTAMRVLEGEERTRAWLEGILANQPIAYPSNSVALEAVAAGEVDVAFINHYYLFQALAEQGESYGARIHFLRGGDVGALVNVAGVGIVDTADHVEAARQFVAFLLSEEAQRYFAERTYEYPLISGVPADPRLPPLEEIETPDIDLSALSDLEGTLRLLQEVGVLE